MDRSPAWIGVLALAWAGVAQAQQANHYVPEETVAFEDLSGADSDADQNDLVIRSSQRCRVDGSGVLLEEEIHLSLLAAGARKTNQLWIALDGTPDTVTVSVDGGSPTTRSVDAQGRFPVATDVRDMLQDPDRAGFVNTDEGPIAAARSYVVHVTWAAGPTVGATCPPADYLLARPDEAVWIDGDTTLASNGQPLRARFPGEWVVPDEQVPVSEAYPDFTAWLADHVSGCTSGCAMEDWYKRPDAERVVARPSLETTAPLPAQAACDDGATNQDETAADCGGDLCGRCDAYQACATHDDCTTGYCDGAACDPRASCDDLLAVVPTTSDGVWTLDPGGLGAFDAYCDMRADGGWTLVMKASSEDTTLVYQSPYWETTDLVNATDPAPNTDPATAISAKYEAFNRVAGQTLELRWQDPAGAAFPWDGLGGGTALDLFAGGGTTGDVADGAEIEVAGNQAGSCNGQALVGAPGYDSSVMRFGQGRQFFGINGESTGNDGTGKVFRYGFGSNDETYNRFGVRMAIGSNGGASLYWRPQNDCSNCGGCYGTPYTPTTTSANLWVK